MGTKTIRVTHIVGQSIVIDTLNHPETIVRYTAESGLPDWSGNIVGSITGTSSSPYYTTQIPNVQNAQEIDIGNTVTSIGEWAFRGCSSLTSVTIPNSVTSIGDRAFTNCSGLTSVTIGNSVTSIGDTAFYNCSGLTRVTFGKGLTSIGKSVFYKCSSCATFDFRSATQVPSLGSVNAFGDTPSNKEIIVPDSLYAEWILATNWSSTSYNIVNCIVKASQSSLGPLQ